MKQTEYRLKLNTKIFLLSSSFILLLFAGELFYLKNTKQILHENTQNKMNLIRIISLPNFAISTNYDGIRHNSYANIMDKLPHDGELLTNSKMSFVYR